MVHNMYLSQVKTPSEAKEPGDLSRLVATVPGEKGLQPLSESR
jgi:branched-chain amino acid transport system substrate-binding protein